MRGWRLLFIALLAMTIVLGWKILPGLQIETSLTDVSPQTKNSPLTQNAIDKLQSSIEQRVLLLITGTDEDTVFDAVEQFRNHLQNVTGITVLPGSEELAEQLISSLASYRFSLLTESQQQILSQRNAAEISKSAQLLLFKTASGGQLFGFDQDPLGWHSETFLDLLDASQSGINNSRPDQGFAQSVSLTIDQGAMNMNTQEILIEKINHLTAQVESEYSVKIERSGVFFYAADAAMHAKRDVSMISAGSTIGVLLLLLFAFGTLTTLLLPIVSIVLGVSFAFVLTHSLYGNVHVLTIVFGASLIGIVIDYSLHYFYHQANASPPAADHAGGTGDALHRALLFSLMTSMIGYAALSFSDLQALQKVAVFSCCGLLMAWLSVVCLGELATRKPIKVNQTVFPVVVQTLTRLLNCVAPRLWIGLAVVTLIGAAVIIKLGTPFSDDPRVFFKPSSVLLTSERKVAAVVNDFEPGRYIAVTGSASAQVYARHQALMRAVSESSEFELSDLSSLLNWVPSPDQQRINYQQQALLYGEGGAAELLSQALSGSTLSVHSIQEEYQQARDRVLFPETVIELFGNAFPPFWIADKTRRGSQNIVNFVLIRKGVNADGLAAVVGQLEGVEYINTLAQTKLALSEQRKSASGLLCIAYLLIALLVLLRYRALSALWLVAVPATASAAMLVVCYVVGISLNLFHIMALFLVLGFGMDYTIFTKEMSDQSSARRSLTQQAILLSALTSLLSFGLLSVSSIPVVASFGLTLLIGNSFNLTGAFIAARVLQSGQKQT